MIRFSTKCKLFSQFFVILGISFLIELSLFMNFHFFMGLIIVFTFSNTLLIFEIGAWWPKEWRPFGVIFLLFLCKLACLNSVPINGVVGVYSFCWYSESSLILILLLRRGFNNFACPFILYHCLLLVCIWFINRVILRLWIVTVLRLVLFHLIEDFINIL